MARDQLREVKMFPLWVGPHVPLLSDPLFIGLSVDVTFILQSGSVGVCSVSR